MKIKYILMSTGFLFIGSLFAQTTETFETETDNSVSFTDNSQVFTISTQAGGLFKISNFSDTGWNGTANDNKYIDNSGTADQGIPVQFSIKIDASALFKLKSLYLFLTKNDLSPAIGACTITGKLGGMNVFTATESTGFNSNSTINNGFTLIDFTNFGGTDNSNKTIDEFVVSTTGEFEYVALDAMNWEKIISLKVDSLEANAFHYYPNPTNSELFLSYSNDITNVKVYNTLGQKVFEKSIESKNSQINMSGYTNGIYFIELTAKGGKKTFKIIKN